MSSEFEYDRDKNAPNLKKSKEFVSEKQQKYFKRPCVHTVSMIVSTPVKFERSASDF